MIDLLKEPKIKPKARRGNQWEVLTGLLALASICVLILSMYLAVRYLFGANYLSLCLRYGYLLSLAFTLVTLVVNLDQDRDLISAHPFHYANACLHLMRGPIQAIGADFKRDTDQHVSHHEPGIPFDATVWTIPLQLAQSLMNAFDLFISGFFSIVFILLVSVWLLVAAPLQYFVFLLCGAPARVIDRSMKKARLALHKAERNILDVPGVELAPAGPLEDGSSIKPVRLTSALALMVLWATAKVLY